MEFEDSKNALFMEPNAYIQQYNHKSEQLTKKIVFAEPYESVPNFYINNNFKKHDCNCVHKETPKKCEHENKNKRINPFGFFNGFNVQGLMPLFSQLSGLGGGNLSNMMNLFNNNAGSGGLGGSIASLLSKPEMLANLTNLFSGNLSASFKNKSNKEVKSTDFEIKNYTRVD